MSYAQRIAEVGRENIPWVDMAMVEYVPASNELVQKLSDQVKPDSMQNFKQLVGSAGAYQLSNDATAVLGNKRMPVPKGTAVTPYGAIFQGIIDFVNSPEGQKTMAVLNKLAEETGMTLVDILKNPDAFGKKLDSIVSGTSQTANNVVERTAKSVGVTVGEVMNINTIIMTKRFERLNTALAGTKTAIEGVDRVHESSDTAKAARIERRRAQLKRLGYNDQQIEATLQYEYNRGTGSKFMDFLKGKPHPLQQARPAAQAAQSQQVSGGCIGDKLRVAQIIVIVLFIIALVAYLTYDMVELRNLVLAFGFIYVGLFLYGKFSGSKKASASENTVPAPEQQAALEK